MRATDDDRWARVRVLFDELVDLPASDRSARVEALAVSDPETRRLVEALLHGDARADERLAHVEPRAASSDPFGLSGRTVSHFRVLERLGSGGMGVVYRAEDVRLGRTVALKFLLPQFTLDADAKARFLHEARATAVLDHPNVCTVHEVGETEDGHPFLAMSCYEGETLKARLARDGALPVEQAIDIASQIARGLARAHAAGIVHRDLKPANVMLTPDGVARILDFGLAKAWDLSLTTSGARVGTIAYMSPEQLVGDAVDARSDLWALGVVLYEMLAGAHPLRGGDVRTARPDVPDALARVVDRLLQRDAEARYASADEVLSGLGAVRAGSTVSPARRRRLALGVVAVTMTLGGVAAGVALWQRAPNARKATTPARAPSLAVLPLRNHSGDPAQDYFADGMTEELTTTLSKMEGLRVIAHQSVRQFRGSNRALPEIARALGGVRYMVDGSVMQAGDSVRIIATLVDATTNSTLLTERFERPRRDVLGLQREVALALADRIAVTLTARDRERLAAARPVDPIAFDWYTKGTQARYLTSMGVGAQGNTSADYFARAIARDPTFAPPYAGLALIHAFDGQEARARTLAQRALALDPALAEAGVALGLIHELHDRDWAAAEGAFRDAVRRNPGYAEAHHELSMLLLRVARFDEAVYESQQTVYLAPTSSRFHGGLGEVYYYGGRYEDALGAAADAFARDSSAGLSHSLRAHVYAELGRYEEAKASVRRFEKAGGGGCRMAGTLRAYIHALEGAREPAREILRVCEDSATRHDQAETAFYIARVHAALGDRARALAWLERASAFGMGALMNVAVDPAFGALHGDPRFRALVKKAGLPESALTRPRLR